MTGLVDGRVALVTGGAGGIGRATAIRLAQEGAAVAVADRDLQGARATVGLLEELGGPALAVAVDVTDPKSVEAMVDAVTKEFGALHGAYNNAGVEDALQPAHLITEKQWDHVVNVDLKGTWLCMKHEIAYMLTHGGGSIVNAASVLAHVTMSNVPAYTAAKHGVAGLTRSAALDYAQNGIRVNAVSPGAIRTELIDRTIASGKVSESDYANLHPMNRLGEPAEVAEAVVWLLSDRSSFVTGHCLAVDGGMLAT
ncbi:SDR family NAD(P)-dependent oxidoreductase [Rhodococcus wratislaviensis]|uniref:Putative oxidoreductase n=1 Tax=Rhodococcus wratislaviensis NBRC 100605 TaxID=1219028 RepID=X0PMB2_RHOWR|nr:SDR family oxidoreductase [Rhodococcus wratislaviensis]GAF43689.1 putative oxidoreductase [Rhodococcus wratislaviensis NBRC 100605]